MNQNDEIPTKDYPDIDRVLSIEEKECLELLKFISSSDKKAILKMLRGKIKSGTKD